MFKFDSGLETLCLEDSYYAESPPVLCPDISTMLQKKFKAILQGCWMSLEREKEFHCPFFIL